MKLKEITRPLKEAAKNTGFKESEVDSIIHKIRKEKEESKKVC